MYRRTVSFIFVCVFVVTFLCSSVFAEDIVPDIKANGSGDIVTISDEDSLTVAVSLDSGSRIGENADWWVVQLTPFGWFHYDVVSDSWAPGLTVTYQGPLIDLPEYKILNINGLPGGTYTFYFGVDMIRNGELDMEDIYYDFVSVVVSNPNKFLLPDTGQTEDYATIFGEDSDYTINPPSYTDNENGAVTDNNTGLMWQKEDDKMERDLKDATNYCNNLSLAGYYDWRLPEIKELSSIVDYSTSIPTIDAVYFPNTISWGSYWSSTTYVGDTSYAWLVTFYKGFSWQTKKSQSEYVYARCVRGEKIIPDFTDNENGTVTDNNTGLMWQQKNDDEIPWEDAITSCEELSLAGFNDWRLPNVKELISIVDYSKYDLAIDEVYFPDANFFCNWTSTTHAAVPDSAWCVNFTNGESSRSHKPGNYLFVRCVRGGQ